MKNLMLPLLLLLLSFQIDAKAQLFERNESFKAEGSKGTDPHGGGGNSGSDPAPIGSGLLVLTGLSIGYACFKRNRKEDWKIFEYYKMGWFTISIFLFFKNFSLIIK